MLQSGKVIASLVLLVLIIPRKTNIIISEPFFRNSNALDNIKFELHLELAHISVVGDPNLSYHFSV